MKSRAFELALMTIVAGAVVAILAHFSSCTRYQSCIDAIKDVAQCGKP